jgi:hypothetical protein
VALTFSVMDAMEELRDVWRGAAPLQQLDGAQTEAARARIEDARKALEKLEQLL